MNFLKSLLCLAQSVFATIWMFGLTYFLLSYLERLWAPPVSAYAVLPMLAFWASQVIVFLAAGVLVRMSRCILVLWVVLLVANVWLIGGWYWNQWRMTFPLSLNFAIDQPIFL